ncbi:MAG: redox-sensing transcriptional repressor Rex [Firmicutes bacterium]|jgi:redox-sensing transcriptional repressor|nr:redox-sensing transcriptional repressor Rex [Bacillota bacterium]
MLRQLPPKWIIKRLPIYLRILDDLKKRDITIISSHQLSRETGFSAEQIRKDLAYYGAFGTRGVGYRTGYLREKLLKITGLEKVRNAVLIGAGHLGIAFARYIITKNPYIDIAGIFDNDPEVIGQTVVGIRIQPMEKIEQTIETRDVKVAIISVPVDVAQEVIDLVVGYGIKAILNFAPLNISVPENVFVHNVDLTNELQSLVYYSTADSRENSNLKK